MLNNIFQNYILVHIFGFWKKIISMSEESAGWKFFLIKRLIDFCTHYMLLQNTINNMYVFRYTMSRLSSLPDLSLPFSCSSREIDAQRRRDPSLSLWIAHAHTDTHTHTYRWHMTMHTWHMHTHATNIFCNNILKVLLTRKIRQQKKGQRFVFTHVHAYTQVYTNI